jgi:hypothetical protein
MMLGSEKMILTLCADAEKKTGKALSRRDVSVLNISVASGWNSENRTIVMEEKDRIANLHTPFRRITIPAGRRVTNNLKCVTNDMKYVTNDLKCAANDTKCAANDTKCVANDLKCAANDLKCVANDTKCAANDTKELKIES